MDMREASAMTEASGLTDHPDVPDTAKVLDPRLPAASLSAQLRKDDGGSSATVALVGVPAGSLGSPSALGAANDRIADSMPRKLKTFQTSLGFYDLAIAVPSMKAALEAWGAGSNLFHQGFAKETDDADVVAATMSRPGVVLRRPAGSNGRFREDADLPTDLGSDEVGARRERTRSKANKRRPPKISESAARKDALEFERDQKRREAERLREEASRERERERREKAVAKAQAALDEAREQHEAKASAIEVERAEVEKRAEDEEARWEKQKEKLQIALREARE